MVNFCAYTTDGLNKVAQYRVTRGVLSNDKNFYYPYLREMPMRIENNKNAVLTIEWFYENDAELFDVICFKKYLGRRKVNLFIPFIPYSNMDSVRDYEECFALKYFAEVINKLDFNQVIALDVHSEVTEALFDNIYNISPEAFLDATKQEIGKDFYLFSSSPRIKKHYNNTTKYYVNDDREIENCRNRNVLIVSDYCWLDIFLKDYKNLKKAGAKDIYLYVTHTTPTVDYKDSPMTKIFTTNSMNYSNDSDKVVVFNIQKEMWNFTTRDD